MSDATTVFATLGPSGTNHELVTGRYIAFHRLDSARIELVADFADAIEMLLDRRVDHVVQCAAHPEFAATIGAHPGHVYAIDTFIAAGKELAVLVRAGAGRGDSIGFQPATKDHVDLTRWKLKVPEPSIVAVAQGLFDGKYDAGITAIEYAEQRPSQLRVEQRIGRIDDVWVVYGRERACTGELLAHADALPASIRRGSNRV